MKTTFLLAFLGLALCGCSPNAAKTSDYQLSFSNSVMTEISENTTGFRRVKKLYVKDSGDMKEWSARAAVEFINPQGGVEWKEMQFKSVVFDYQGKTHVTAISQAQLDIAKPK